MNKDLDQKIIDYLKVHSKFVTSDELSEEFKVSKKTIARHINSLNLKYPETIIVSKRGSGYKLKYATYLSFINQSVPINSSMRLRQDSILTKLLLASPSSVKINDLVNSLYVSESVLQNDERKISNKIKYWNLKLKHKSRMLRIVGNEKDIRNALIQTVLHVNKSTDIIALKENKINQEDFNFALKQVEFALGSLNGTLPYPYNVNFFTHIYILLERIHKYKSVDQSIAGEVNVQVEIKKNPEIFSICQKIVNNIQEYLNVNPKILKNEVYYLFEYLITSRFNLYDGVVLGDRDLAGKVTNSFIKLVEKNLHFSFDSKIKDDIKDHVLSMISRLKMNISLPNALLSDIKFEYPDVFLVTKQATFKIQEEYKLPQISDDEIGFICLYFVKYYEQKDQVKRKVRAYIICTTGIGTSGIISTRIKNLMPEIQIVGLASSINIEKILETKSDIDLLVSTVPINKKLKIPVELVSAFFTKKDEIKVREAVRKIQNEE